MPALQLHYARDLEPRRDHGNYARPRSFSPGVLFVFCLIGATLGLLAWWLFIRRGGFFWKSWDWDDYKASVLRKPELRPSDALTVFSDGSVRRAGASVAGSCVGPARTVVLGELHTTYQKSMVVRSEKGYEETKDERRRRRRALREAREREAAGQTITRSLWGRLRGGNGAHHGDVDTDADTMLQREKSLARARGRYKDNVTHDASELGYNDGFSYVDDHETPARPLQSVTGHSETSSQQPLVTPPAATHVHQYPAPPTTSAPVSRMASYARGDEANVTRKKTTSRHMEKAKSRSTRDEQKRPLGARPPTQKIKSRDSRSRPSDPAAPGGGSRHHSNKLRSSKQPSTRQPAGHRYVAAPVADDDARDHRAERRRSRRPESKSRSQSRPPPPGPAATSSRRNMPPDPDSESSITSSSEEEESSDEEMNPSEIGMAKGTKVYTHPLNRENVYWSPGRPAERSSAGAYSSGPIGAGGGVTGSAGDGGAGGGNSGALVKTEMALARGYRRGSAGSLSSVGSVGSSNAGR